MASDIRLIGSDPPPGKAVLAVYSHGMHGTRVFARCNCGGEMRDFEIEDVLGVAWENLDPEEAPTLTMKAVVTEAELDGAQVMVAPIDLDKPKTDG